MEWSRCEKGDKDIKTIFSIKGSDLSEHPATPLRYQSWLLLGEVKAGPMIAII
jgi:hypothetical protein